MSFIPAGNVIKNLIYRIAGGKYRELISISFAWKRIVGKLMAEKTIIYKFENNVLFVNVSNNIWLQELVLQKYEILRRIKEELKIELDDIVFFMRTNDANKRYYRKRNHA
ncbi:MAG: DUF721 domain-containing protein [Candidatus Cloacimonadota bacterium]|nr:MAG: DUF721 domain-containing protein [Candidatus Cloacimonadota bacterium]